MLPTCHQMQVSYKSVLRLNCLGRGDRGSNLSGELGVVFPKWFSTLPPRKCGFTSSNSSFPIPNPLDLLKRKLRCVACLTLPSDEFR
uniref:Uncharacterized protein n=1 Tax=Timema poppense TaxID=170557 RepID=A0A7R9DB61_TIMPO|nr:unnamed protein product [Timema poppensis]